MTDLFAHKGPRVYNVPAGVAVVDALADGLMRQFADDPAALSHCLVLVPTRRAILALRTALLRLTDGASMIMPRIRALGDVDEDELILTMIPALAEQDLSLKPAIDKTERLALLTQQVMRAGPALGLDHLTLATATQMARELGRLLDSCQIEQVGFENLAELAPEKYAAHWQITLEFLEIVTKFWPAILDDLHRLDPAERRIKSLEILTQFWQQNPPEYPVIVAGSTGSVPATARLMKTIARLPKGAVLLPAMDQDMPDDAWELLDVTHPQATMKNLLEVMGVVRAEVRPWPLRQELMAQIEAGAPRMRLIQQALWPSDAVAQWRHQEKPDLASAFKGISSLTVPSIRDEATAIALMMRQTLERTGVTAALVTPDRSLARRVKQELGRWGIGIDDSAGDPLSQTPPASFILLLAEMVEADFAPVPLLAALKHPMAAMGGSRSDHLTWLRRLERDILRGVRPKPGIKGLLETISTPTREDDHRAIDRKALRQKGDQLEVLMAPLMGLNEATASFHEWLRALLTVAEAMASSDQKAGSDILWSQENGHSLAAFISGLLETPSLKALRAGDNIHAEYSALLRSFMQGEVVRRSHSRHPRLAIWGTIEARMQQADVMILAGLNEESWPPAIADDPWMSRPMRADFGLPPLERRIGLSAHDFVQACGAKEVVLTRSEKLNDGAEAVPSRWLMRLEAMLGGDFATAGREPWQAYVDQLDHADEPGPVAAPKPCPPVAKRPNNLSVTGIESWMKDPYSIYAKHILRLKPWEPLDQKPNALTRGNIIHDALERFLEKPPKDYREKQYQDLLAHGVAAFGEDLKRPGVWAFWWPRFEQVARAFIALQFSRKNTYKPVLVEQKKTLRVPVDGLDFELVAKADRIDQSLSDGSYQVIDYKTGKPPTAKAIIAGFAPQLPLEGVMVEAGAFDSLTNRTVSGLSFWRVSGGREPLIESEIKDVEDRIKEAGEGLVKLIRTFRLEETPYLCNPRPAYAGYGDYDHLARLKEWRVSGDAGDGQ